MDKSKENNELWGWVRSLSSEPLWVVEGELTDVNRALEVCELIKRFEDPDEAKGAAASARAALQRVGVDVRLFDVALRWSVTCKDDLDYERAYPSARAGYVGFFRDAYEHEGETISVWWDRETLEVLVCDDWYGSCPHTCAWEDAREDHGEAGVVWHAFNLAGQMDSLGVAQDIVGVSKIVASHIHGNVRGFSYGFGSSVWSSDRWPGFGLAVKGIVYPG